MAKFDRRFKGKENAGLRSKIRAAVCGNWCGDANERAVLSLAGVVAMTASGRATLTEVAADYRRAGDSRGNERCDCGPCVAGKLQFMGAFG